MKLEMPLQMPSNRLYLAEKKVKYNQVCSTRRIFNFSVVIWICFLKLFAANRRMDALLVQTFVPFTLNMVKKLNTVFKTLRSE